MQIADGALTLRAVAKMPADATSGVACCPGWEDKVLPVRRPIPRPHDMRFEFRYGRVAAGNSKAPFG